MAFVLRESRIYYAHLYTLTAQFTKQNHIQVAGCFRQNFETRELPRKQRFYIHILLVKRSVIYTCMQNAYGRCTTIF